MESERDRVREPGRGRQGEQERAIKTGRESQRESQGARKREETERGKRKEIPRV